jgi:hypothetical protein
MQLVSSLIKGGVHAHSFFLNLFSMAGPQNDPFAALLRPTLRNDIGSFVSSFFMSAKSTITPEFSLHSRFMVTLIGINKANSASQHESVAVWVVDSVTQERHEYVVERVPSKDSYASRFAIFSNFPSHETVLESLKNAINNMRTLTSKEAQSLTAALVVETELVPLLPLAFDSDPLLTDPSPISDAPPFKDVVTTAIARGIALARSASQTISPQSLALDSISGRSSDSLKPERCIRQFRPVQLSMFDLALLAQVVHENAPVYGLFSNQCYLFSSVIFDAVVQRFSLPPGAYDFENISSPSPSPSTLSGPGPSSGPSFGVPAPTPEVDPPKDADLVFLPSPSEDGRWSGLLIVDPILKRAVVSVVVSRFRELRVRYINDLQVPT